MKKAVVVLLFTVSLLGAKKANSEEFSGEGRCCQFFEFSCYHPIGMNFPDSIWVTGNFCLPITPPILG